MVHTYVTNEAHMAKEDEFVQLIRSNEGIIYKITSIYTTNHQDQQDLYQDIVYQLWKYYDSFRGEAKVSTWMYRVAMNTAITRSRREQRKGYRVSIDSLFLKASEVYDDAMEDNLKKLRAHIQRLNDLEKGLILLLLEGKTYQEIAQIMGISAGNVGTRLTRIKKKLKKQLNKA